MYVRCQADTGRYAPITAHTGNNSARRPATGKWYPDEANRCASSKKWSCMGERGEKPTSSNRDRHSHGHRSSNLYIHTVCSDGAKRATHAKIACRAAAASLQPRENKPIDTAWTSHVPRRRDSETGWIRIAAVHFHVLDVRGRALCRDLEPARSACGRNAP
ncbi:hypothetical protein BSIN_2061 [Burkholderia singularis]|uniref:Uncharacterized protein n=1 Tax=Burkholderia singularis TaxID=1503053 RepID=A0A238H0L0_9BURK|nr:hypothetical protein BSIN_2061 [Burkholderia singularis]